MSYGIKGCKFAKQGLKYVNIVADEYEKCLIKAGMPDVLEVSRALYKSKRILKYGDKFRKAQKMGDIKVICYTVLLTDDTDEIIKKREEQEAKKKAAAIRKSKIKTLIDDSDDEDFEFDEFTDEELSIVTTDNTVVLG